MKIQLIQRRLVERARTGPTETFVVRWTVARRARSRSFPARPLAAQFRAELWEAARQGQPFRLDSGLPVKLSNVSVFEFAQRYLSLNWAGWAARTRETNAYALMVLVCALTLPDVPDRPRLADLRTVLRTHALLPPERQEELPPELRATLSWLEKASRPLADLEDPGVLHDTMAAFNRNVDGSPAAPNTFRRRRQALNNLLQLAVEEKKLGGNPLGGRRWSAPQAKLTLDPRTVVSPAQARALLAAVATVGRDRGKRLRPAFACMYFAALRPEEVAGLRAQDCHLPDDGWGVLYLEKTRPSVSKQFSDTGDTREERGLKHRTRGEVREVPAPPELVRILVEHMEAYGTAPDGRMFFTPTGKPYAYSTMSRVWQEARRRALTPTQAASRLGARPYDLRHAAVSLWLSAGVPLAEVAQRAGHGIDVLLKIYAKCIDGQREVANQRISEALKPPE